MNASRVKRARPGGGRSEERWKKVSFEMLFWENEDERDVGELTRKLVGDELYVERVLLVDVYDLMGGVRS